MGKIIGWTLFVCYPILFFFLYAFIFEPTTAFEERSVGVLLQITVLWTVLVICITSLVKAFDEGRMGYIVANIFIMGCLVLGFAMLFVDFFTQTTFHTNNFPHPLLIIAGSIILAFIFRPYKWLEKSVG